jgi:phosphoribosylanthranilate isomerase
MQHTKIKICGIRDIFTAEVCIQNEVNYLGFNFSPKSIRSISIQDADKIISSLHSNGIPESSSMVALFFETDLTTIETVMHSGLFTLFQYVVHDSHFDRNKYPSNTKFLPQFGVTQELTDKSIELNDDLIILDKFSSNSGGGSGETFLWNHIQTIKKKYLLAGGLNPENVSKAIEVLNPYGVDVASGVESEKGIKDIKKIKRFVENVRR